jgi:siroheme synthase (precorrin-2 oxidase/ferrochelatase)
MKHKYMPVSVSLEDRRCLVVGGGPVALRKVETLLDYETTITVVAPEVHEKLEYHAGLGRINLEKRAYQSQQVHEDARGAGTLVNVVDDPPYCDFIFPAVLRRDCLTAAISTDGKAPFISGHLRLVLDSIFPEHWGRLMRLAASFRSKVRGRWGDDAQKKNLCYAEFLEADWKRMLKELNEDQLEEELRRMLEIPE